MNPVPVEGDLGLGTFPSLLRRLSEDRATGVLRILVDGVERRVYFRWGYVIFASSGLPADRLDQRLLREGKVSSTTLLMAYDEQKSTGKRFGECLVDLGALTEEELLRAVERQVREVLRFLFSLSRGHFVFAPSEEPLDEDLMLDLPMQQILLDGIRSMNDPLALRIGVSSMNQALHVRVPLPGGVPMGGPQLNSSEAFLYSRIDGRSSPLDLLAISPLGELETLRSIAALLSIGMVGTEPPARDE